MWVKSEYAGELAVLSAWLAALVPWNVTYSTFGDLGSMLFVRFPLFQVQFERLTIDLGGEFRQSGVQVVDGVWVADPWSALQFYASGATGTANAAWFAGGVVVGLALLLSVAMYVNEERVEAGPVDPVRAMGALLGLGSLLLAASTYLFWQVVPGVPIPVGVVVLLVLSATLLTVERTDAPPGEDPEAAEA